MNAYTQGLHSRTVYGTSSYDQGSTLHCSQATSKNKKAFLQIRIKADEEDSLRFHWRPSNSSEAMVFRFTRALFGICSTFLLGGDINQHLDLWESRHSKLIKELRDGLYVDYLMAGGETVEQTAAKKITATEVFTDATFTIHKWYANAQELEAPSESQSFQSPSTSTKQ